MTFKDSYKKIGVLALMFTLFFQSFNKALIIADYYVNTDSYALNCENKTQVQMQCNGKCQMMKKLIKKEEKEKQNPQRKAENNRDIVVFFEKPVQLMLTAYLIEKGSYYPKPVPETIDRSQDIFHPPAA